MKIHLRQIPEGDTLHIEGEEDAAPLELELGGFKPTGPLAYELDAGQSGQGIFATGRLKCDGTLTCVNCLEEFPWTLAVDDFSTQVEIGNGESVDLTPSVREDMHLLLPAHPKCDHDGHRPCPARLPTDSGAATQNPVPPSPVWDALSQITIKNT